MVIRDFSEYLKRFEVAECLSFFSSACLLAITDGKWELLDVFALAYEQLLKCGFSMNDFCIDVANGPAIDVFRRKIAIYKGFV